MHAGVQRTGDAAMNNDVTIWGVHNDQSQLDLVGNGFISVAWGEVGDIRQFGEDRDWRGPRGVVDTFLIRI